MKFRPGDLPQADPSEEDSPVEWTDNSLSNTLAWASHRFAPAWCQSEDHWTAVVTQYLFTDCPCCLLFRGLFIGVVIGWAASAIAVAIGITIAALTS